MKKLFPAKFFGIIALLGILSGAASTRADEMSATQLLGRAQSTLHTAKKGADYKAALDDLTKAIALEPKNAGLYFWRGEAIRWAIRFQGANPMAFADAGFDDENFVADSARRDYDKAIELDPKNARAFFGRASLTPPRQTTSVDTFARNVVADLDKAIALDPKLGEAYLRRAFFRSVIAKSNLDEILVDYDKGIALGLDAKSQDPIFAVLIAPNVLSSAYNGRALIELTRNQNDKALQDFSAAIQNSEDNLGARLGRARLYHAAGDDKNALIDLNATITAQPDYSDALLLRAEIYDKQNQAEKARADVVRAFGAHWEVWDALKNTPLEKYLPEVSAATVRQRADAFARQNWNDEALKEYSRALQLGPRDAASLDGRSMIYARQKDWPRALTDLNQAVEIEPKNVRYVLDRGQVFARSGELEKADADFGKALELDPKSSAAWEQRGILQQARGEYSASEISFSQAIDFAGKSASPEMNSAPLARLRLLIVRAVQGEANADSEKILGATNPELLRAGVLLADIEIKKHPDAAALKALRKRMNDWSNAF